MRCRLILVVLFASLCSVALAGPAYTDPDKADADFPFQGEYSGVVKGEGEEQKIGLQVIAQGKGKFRAVGYVGGLPGDGWNKMDHKEVEGELQNGELVFSAEGIKAVVKNGEAKISVVEGNREIGTLGKVNRSSTTLGAKPAEGAIVLFAGKDQNQFEGGKVSEDGLLIQGCSSKQKFGSHKVHLEFRLPYQPEDRGQGRGNSGMYLQSRYEVQILDSFGLKGENNECGGVYTVKAPDVNMCYPPLSWQTYDVEYHAAKFDKDGKVTQKAKMTVYHNGVLIHKDLELPADRGTTASPMGPGPSPGSLYLQDHGNPVRFRNVWVVELKDE
ncbi:MAG: 3-keto-disaccharide hydrolase [Planctomycetaceae bacterium]